MADPFSLAASILGVADVGLRVATKLYTYVNAVYRAPQSVRQLAQEVSLTSAVLSELGSLLKSDGAARLCSPNAISTTDEAVKGCEQIFKEIGEEVEKAGGGVGVRKFVWPLMENKVQVLMSGLERGKSLLLLMLNVITFAKQVSEEKTSDAVLREQRILIVQLEKKNEESKRQYEYLKHTLISAAYVTQPDNPGPFPTPKPTLTGDTTVGIESTNHSKGQTGEDACLCGQSSGKGDRDHIYPKELQEYQNKLERYFDRIDAGRKHLGKIILSPGLGCESTRGQLDSIVENLELLMLWQATAVYEQGDKIVMQDASTRIYEGDGEGDGEALSVEITDARQKISLVSRIRQWASSFRREKQFNSKIESASVIPSSAIVPQHIQNKMEIPGDSVVLTLPFNKIQTNSGRIEIIQEQESGPSKVEWKPSSMAYARLGEENFHPGSTAAVNRLLKKWTTLDDSKIKEPDAVDNSVSPV